MALKGTLDEAERPHGVTGNSASIQPVGGIGV